MPSPTSLQNWPISLAEVRDLHLQEGRINRILAGKESVEARNAQRIRSGTQPGWSKSTLASVYADELYRESMVRLSQDPGIHFFAVNGQRFIRVSSSKIAAVSRFKKVRENWLSSNYRTTQSIAWNGQRPLLDVPPVSPHRVCMPAGLRADTGRSHVATRRVHCRMDLAGLRVSDRQIPVRRVPA